jgi:REP element-mobilizing transposase RayT
MKKLQIPLEEERFYHVFNRGNNGIKLFYHDRNYEFFTRRLFQYLSELIEIYTYCLLPNHFHLLIRVKEHENLLIQREPKKDPVSYAFHRLFTSYSKAINKQEQRHGSLLENPFKRKVVTDEEYLKNLVVYIHANPEFHGIHNDFRTYPWSSYQTILSKEPSKLEKNEVLQWFDGIENYIYCHQKDIETAKINDLIIE